MSDPEPAAPRGSLLRWGLLTVGAFFSLGCCFGSGVVVGLLRKEGEYRNEQYRRERELIAPILAADPAYSRIEIYPLSVGGISLVGGVPTAADKDRLREQVIRAVGEARASQMMLGIDVLDRAR